MAGAVELTETLIKKAGLAPEQKRAMLWDARITGLGLRLLAGGSKTFWFQYRPGKGGRGTASRMVRIGAWPAVTLGTARKTAQGYAGEVAHGKDPAEEKQEERRKTKATLRQLLAENGEYERHLERRRVVNTKVILSGLRRGLARLMSKDVAEIERRDYVAAITAIEDQGKPGAAADLRKFIHTFCEWCVGRGFVQANVMGGLRQAKQTRAERVAAEAKRARALDDGEIAAVWNACEGRGSFGNIVRLLLLTGARRGEIAKLIREQIRSDCLVLPPLSTKTGVEHQIPLTEMMRTVIAAQPRTTNAFVFASERTGGVIRGWTKLVKALQRESRVDFTLHDLRRTCRTLMSRLGVESDIAELAIGHAREGLEKRYNFDTAWSLRCEALVKVSKHVAGLLERAAEEGKVVAIPARV